VEEGHEPIELTVLVKGGTPDALPPALLAQALESAPHGRWCAVAAWEALPAAVGTEHREDAVDGLAVVSAGPPSARAMGGADGQKSVACQEGVSWLCCQATWSGWNSPTICATTCRSRRRARR